MDRIVFQKPEHPENAQAYLRTLRQVLSTHASDPSALPETLERAVAQATGSVYACAFHSTSTALKVFFEFHGVGKGHQVLCPSYMPIDYVHAVLRAGATPIFVDLEPDGYTLGLSSAIRGLSEKTRALILFYPYGIPCDPAPFARLCQDHGLLLVEVVAGGLGARYRDKFLGTHGQAGILEFHPKRASLVGEGGFLATDDEAFSRFARKWLLSRTVLETDPETPKKRISEFYSAVGLWHVDRLGEACLRRARIAKAYDAAFSEIPGVRPASLATRGHWSHPYYPVLIDGERRNRVRDLLGRHGIDTEIGYAPAHQNTFVEALIRPPRLHFAEAAHEKTLLLPIYPTMPDGDRERVIDAVAEALATYRYQSKLEVYA